MKFGQERIAGFVMKPLASGRMYYGWEPTPKQRKAGWKSLKLPDDLPVAIAAARARNEEIGAWQAGGAKPRAVARFTRAQTFGAVLDRYEREILAGKAVNTRRVDATAIGRLREWAGDKPAAWITRRVVKSLREALMNGIVIDGPGHAPVFHLLSTLRKIMGWWIREQDLGIPNPADHFGVPMPAPRWQIWAPDARAAMAEAAQGLGLDSIDLAFEIGVYFAQREADVIDLQRSQWREMSLAQLGHDQVLYDALTSDAGPDAGKVMGFYVRQRKTKQWVGVPIEGALRARVEAAIAANLARARASSRVEAQHIIVKEGTARPWGQSDFIHRFKEVRDAAVAVAIMDGNDELAERLHGLQFRDLRRTCIVALGTLGLNDYQIASITGHKQETIKRILEVYMPRTEAAAAHGVVARIDRSSTKSRNSDRPLVGMAGTTPT